MPIAQTRLETLQICKLLQCVREKDLDQIRKLTASGVPHLINYNEPTNGDTALGVAAVANDDPMIEFLLELGAHPDVMDFKGRTAAMRAAEFGHVQCLEKLAHTRANMTLTDLEGKGILFYCIEPTQRHQKCMELVLTHGADVNNKTKAGVAVFLEACETAKDNESTCKMMLEKGSDPNSKNEKTKRTALMAAACSGSAAVVRAILEKGAEVNELMMRTKTHAAHEAAKGGHLDVLQVMSAYGAMFDQTDDQGNTPIHLAAKAGHGLCIRFLGQRGCNPKTKNSEGMQASAIAKEEGHKEALKESKKAMRTFGKTARNNEPWALALYDFCYERQAQLKETFEKFDADSLGSIPKEDFMEVLANVGAPIPTDSDFKRVILAIDKGKDVGLDYNDFLSAKKYINKLYLMSAFEGKKKKKKGGKGKKKKGKTKIAMPICTQADGPRAVDGGPPEAFIAQHIHFTDSKRFDRDCPPDHPLQDDSAWYLQHPDKTYLNVNDAAKHGDLDSLKDALAQGMSIDVRDKYFKTPLMVACNHGNLQVAQFLVDNGANVNSQDGYKWTPLHFACHSGMKDIVEYLLSQGANLEATSLNGATPFIRAIESSKPEIVQLLIDRGCKVQIENRKGHNPIDIAGHYGDPRVYDIVRIKWESLPPPPDKKKGAKGAKKAAKRPGSSPNADAKDPPPAPAATDAPTGPPAPQRKGSILRAASALAGGLEEQEDITYTPLKIWTQQATTADLLCAKEVKRQRYGWEVDFPDFKMPFLKHAADRAEELGGDDD